MTRNKFSFLSSDAKTSIHGELWLPEGPVRAVVQIAHGVSEYILRYEPLAAYLTERGIAVVGNDHLGHGSSVAPGAPRLYFGPKGSWMHVVEDLYTLRSQVGRQAPDVPWFLLGHSMGSFLARTYLIRYPGTVSGAVLVGTGQMSPALIAGGRAIAAREARRVGHTTNASPPTAPPLTGSPWIPAMWTGTWQTPCAEKIPPRDCSGKCSGASPTSPVQPTCAG